MSDAQEGTAAWCVLGRGVGEGVAVVMRLLEACHSLVRSSLVFASHGLAVVTSSPSGVIRCCAVRNHRAITRMIIICLAQSGPETAGAFR